MQKYIDFMWNDHLQKHFSDEEHLLFPVLKHGHKLINKAIEDHKIIKSLFFKEISDVKNIRDIAHKLEEHIRFEERILFNLIQEHLSDEQIDILISAERRPSCGLWEDMFWR